MEDGSSGRKLLTITRHVRSCGAYSVITKMDVEPESARLHELLRAMFPDFTVSVVPELDSTVVIIELRDICGGKRLARAFLSREQAVNHGTFIDGIIYAVQMMIKARHG